MLQRVRAAKQEYASAFTTTSEATASMLVAWQCISFNTAWLTCIANHKCDWGALVHLQDQAQGFESCVGDMLSQVRHITGKAIRQSLTNYMHRAAATRACM